MVLLAVATAWLFYLMTIVWLNPERTALSFRFVVLILPVFGVIGFGLTAIDFLGLRFQDMASVSDEGLIITTPRGRVTKFFWSDHRYTFAMMDWRERPNDLMHGKPGIYLKVMLGRKVAWIDEQTFTRIVSVAKVKGWSLKHFEFLRDKGANQWVEKRVIAVPPDY
jgi:hypothetical protein